jgi:hypothetical protein
MSGVETQLVWTALTFQLCSVVVVYLWRTRCFMMCLSQLDKMDTAMAKSWAQAVENENIKLQHQHQLLMSMQQIEQLQVVIVRNKHRQPRTARQTLDRHVPLIDQQTSKHNIQAHGQQRSIVDSVYLACQSELQKSSQEARVQNDNLQQHLQSSQSQVAGYQRGLAEASERVKTLEKRLEESSQMVSLPLHVCVRHCSWLDSICE